MTLRDADPATTLDDQVVELSHRHLPLAVEILRECIRIPADYVDRSPDDGGDPSCGLSNHEGPRLEYLRRRIVEIGAVRSADDVGIDGFGNLVWTVQDPDDGIAPEQKRVVYFDGHTDTVRALRDAWRDRFEGAIDCYDGAVDLDLVDRAAVRAELGYLPPDDEWHHLVFGRGAADQLSGVVTQVLATKIMLELAEHGALAGVIVRAHATVCEEDNDGAGPMYLMREVLPGAGRELVPDVVLLSEGTGDAQKGALGIYRGQRGRMQIQLTVTGRSSHGSMPWEGLNPLEYGGAIVAEAARRYEERDGFADDPFLGHGTRTASWALLDTPSDCAVPDRFTVRFDRRLTAGELPDEAVAHIERLDAVRVAREAGLTVDIDVPTYDAASWQGYRLDNLQIYPGWATPEEHPAVSAAVSAYDRVVGPDVTEGSAGAPRRAARVDRWIFSTDGVGFPVAADDGRIAVGSEKNWVTTEGGLKHPPMLGFGPGIEQNTHKIGECVDERELRSAISFYARYPSVFATPSAQIERS